MSALVFTETASSFNALAGGKSLGFEIYAGNATCGDDYSTNGLPVTTALIDATLPSAASIVQVLCGGGTVDGLHVISWDSVNSKIQAYDIADGAEVADETDMSAAAKSFSLVVIVAPGE